MLASDKVTCALPSHEFTRKGTSKPSFTFSAFPFCVDFHRLLKQKAESILPGVSKWDLLNIVIALYDVCLPDIGLETLRENVCASGSKTILLLRDPQDVLKEYQEKPSGDYLRASSVPFPSDGEEEEEKAGVFSSVFSDSESSEEEEDSESDREESEKFQSSLRDFLMKVVERHQQRTQSRPTREAIGVESCIVAALTYKRSALKSKEKILELSLLSTRRRFRCCGVGTHMLKMLKDVSLVGFYDSIVTHADGEAVGFFKSCGFSDDLILNSKFRDLEDEWTNTTTMSYFPPFSAVPALQKDLTDLEMEMELWKMKSIAAYQAQTIFMNRIFQEIRTLRNQVASQNDEITKLTAELEKAKDEKYLLEKTFLQHQLRGLHLSIDSKDSVPGAFQTADLQNDVGFTSGDGECVEQPVAVQDCVQASLSKNTLLNVKAHVSKLAAPVIHQRLYYGRGQQTAERLEDILTTGFTERDFYQGEYGTGLYFSADPAAASNLSTPHQVLVADVYIGRTEVVYQKQPGRIRPSDGCDSLLVPGMTHSLSQKEFVIFSPLQAIPICVLKYTQKGDEMRTRSTDCPAI
ncbi:uncharacterized protein LOC128467317 [Spea bombifrons]|uniref:uncharacterized protein LOC128467317 n=1 Tax=Spea bombifrons TaxID=233779 RepID=UPI00234BEF7F|nr:uncharacterized protein LOC128467317 [Spea bombifrons]